jgi:hypothetical protein
MAAVVIRSSNVRAIKKKHSSKTEGCLELVGSRPRLLCCQLLQRLRATPVASGAIPAANGATPAANGAISLSPFCYAVCRVTGFTEIAKVSSAETHVRFDSNPGLVFGRENR